MKQKVVDESLSAELKYLSPSSEKPVYHASEGGKNASLELSGDFEVRRLNIIDARYQMNSGAHENFSLEREGFTLIEHHIDIEDFYTEEQIKEQYLPAAENLVKKVTGANRVVAFDVTFRSDAGQVREEAGSREPSTVVHNDYTKRSAPQRVRDLMADEADTLLSQRFAIINVWRSINAPVFSSPLALCDAQSVNEKDLIAVERRAKNRTGELLMANYKSQHRWYYFKFMTPEEALLIKTFDSLDEGVATSCIHSAFVTDNVPVEAPPRESIEVRTFVFY